MLGHTVICRKAGYDDAAIHILNESTEQINGENRRAIAVELFILFFYYTYFIRLPYTTRPSCFCDRVNFKRRASSFFLSGARSSIKGMISSGAHCFCSRKSCENRAAGSAGSSDRGKYEINQLFRASPDDRNRGVLMYTP